MAEMWDGIIFIVFVAVLHCFNMQFLGDICLQTGEQLDFHAFTVSFVIYVI